jgi:hypothetical protein
MTLAHGSGLEAFPLQAMVIMQKEVNTPMHSGAAYSLPVMRLYAL